MLRVDIDKLQCWRGFVKEFTWLCCNVGMVMLSRVKIKPTRIPLAFPLSLGLEFDNNPSTDCMPIILTPVWWLIDIN